MKLTQEIERQVNKKFNDLQEYTTLFNKKSSEDKKSILESKNLITEGKNLDADKLEELGMNTLYINGFHQLDLRNLQSEFVNLVRFAKTVYPELKMSKEMEDVYKILDNALPKNIFIVDSGVFKERESGKVNQIMNNYKQKGLFKLFNEQIMKLINNA